MSSDPRSSLEETRGLTTPDIPGHGEERLGRYRLLERVGEGGMGVVHRAYDEQLDRMVALKIVRTLEHGEEETHERLLREGRALARLHHPNVVKVHDVGVVDGRLFLAMELVRGPTLKDWLAERPRGWREVLPILIGAGQGIAAAHDAGIVHRDFKPANVLIGGGPSGVDEPGANRRVRVADFGLARSVAAAQRPEPTSSSSSAELTGLTEVGTVLGTPAYMAPEQHLGEAPGPLADQFTFCVVLWEAVHGQRPFSGTSLQELVSNIAHGRTTAQRRPIPRWLHAVIVRGLSPDPSQRYRSMSALLRELRRRPARARINRIAMGAAIAVALAGGLGVQQTFAERRHCAEQASRAVTAWTPAEHAAARERFAGTMSAWTPSAWERIFATLDEDARAWQAAWRTACEADALDDRTARCLAGHAEDRTAYVDAIASSDRAALVRSIDALAVLSSPQRCARPDREPSVASVARARVLVALARFAEAERESTTAIAEAAAEGHLTRSLAEQGSGRLESAVESMWEAAWAAEATARDVVGAEAWVHLVHLSASRGAHDDELRGTARLAADAIARAGGDDDLSRTLALELAEAAAAAGRHEDAATFLAELPTGTSSVLPELIHARTLLRRGRIRLAIDEPVEAASDLVRALAMASDVYGPAHPRVAEFFVALADALAATGAHAQAEAHRASAASLVDH